MGGGARGRRGSWHGARGRRGAWAEGRVGGGARERRGSWQGARRRKGTEASKAIRFKLFNDIYSKSGIDIECYYCMC